MTFYSKTDREQLARHAALLHLAAAHDKFAEREQVQVGRGDYVAAEHYHKYVAWIVRAYRAEMDDPTPQGLGDA